MKRKIKALTVMLLIALAMPTVFAQEDANASKSATVGAGDEERLHFEVPDEFQDKESFRTVLRLESGRSILVEKSPPLTDRTWIGQFVKIGGPDSNRVVDPNTRVIYQVVPNEQKIAIGVVKGSLDESHFYITIPSLSANAYPKPVQDESPIVVSPKRCDSVLVTRPVEEGEVFRYLSGFPCRVLSARGGVPDRTVSALLGEKVELGQLEEGEVVQLDFQNSKNLRNVKITAGGSVEDGAITMNQVDEEELDRENIGDVNEEVVSYLRADLENIEDSDIRNAYFTFSVDKDKVDASAEGEVVMMRYRDEWREYTARRIGETDDKYLFLASTPGMSYLAIAVKEVDTDVSDFKVGIITLLVFATVLVVGGVCWARRKKEKRRDDRGGEDAA